MQNRNLSQDYSIEEGHLTAVISPITFSISLGNQKNAVLRIVPQDEDAAFAITARLVPRKLRRYKRKEEKGKLPCISGLRNGKKEKWGRREDTSPSLS